MSLNKIIDKMNLSDSVGNKTISENNVHMDVTLNDDSDDGVLFQGKGVEVRKLTDEEIQKLNSDKKKVSEFKHRKLELEAKKNWDLFYRRNKAKFFKDRYWTFREFDELNSDHVDVNESFQLKTLLEIGCGVGNFAYPLLRHNKQIFAYVCDFSTDAIQLVKANSEYDTHRMLAFVCDATKPKSLVESLPQGVKVDAVTLIFVLSAIHPTKMHIVVENIAQVLRPGGIVLVRDYGIYDHSMIRFQPGHKLEEKFYARQDGTRTFFFSLEDINNLFLNDLNASSSPATDSAATSSSDADAACGLGERLFEKSISEYVFRETVNVKENLRVPRVFIQSKFIRTDRII